MAARTIKSLSRQIEGCNQCPRLREWCTQVAKEKRASYKDETYWGKPVPGFGDQMARILIIGLAPGAHGANRTGRMFSGDRSGDWLYGAMYRAGLANQPFSVGRDDGLELKQAYVTNIVRCAPPDNKPDTQERDTCIEYFFEELRLLKQVKVIIALGGFAWDGALKALAGQGHAVKPKPKFGHEAEAKVGPYTLVGSYHPSQQNTFTGRLTEPMFDQVFKLAKKRADLH